MRKLFILLLLSSCLPPVMAEAMRLEIIPLQYRTSADIIPILRPLLAEGGSISGMNNQLIVKTTANNLDEIRQILQTLDKAARRLMIYVKQDIDGETYDTEQSVSGTYSKGDIRISNRTGPGPREGVEIGVKDGQGNKIRYRDLSTRSTLEDKNTFQVQTVEGQAAFIQSGQSVPIASQNAYVSGGHVIIQDNIEYRDVTSGFYVLPRLSGNRVTLLISPNLSRINPQHGAVFDIQNVETTTSGYLGEWINIGAVNSNVNDNSSAILRSTRHQNQENRSVYVKVVEIP